MKIEEIISLYEFLTTCGWWGDVAVWFILSLILGTTILWGKEKLDVAQSVPRWIMMSIISLVVLVMVVAFHFDAEYRKFVLMKANCVKSEFITYGYKVASDSTIRSKNFHCNCDSPMIEKILKEHPNEFIRVITDDRSPGIRIIDEQALEVINKYNQSHIPFIKSRIFDHMTIHRTDCLSYSAIRKDVNSDFDDEWIELMLSRYDSLFTPFNTQCDTIKYGDSHFVKLTEKAKENRGKKKNVAMLKYALTKK